MQFFSPKAAVAVALIAATAVAGTAVAQTDTAEPAGPGPAAVMIAPDSEVESVAGDELAASGAPSFWVPITPYRAFDSRDNPGFRLFSVQEGNGALALRVSFDDEDQRAIPATATGVTYNVTIDGQLGSGYLTIASIDQPTSEAAESSTINWSGPGSAIANGSSVALGPFEGFDGYVKVLVGGAASGTEYIIDITGYYTAATPA